MLDELLKLHTDGKMVLTQINIEKIHCYLETNKVLNAAGIDSSSIPQKERVKIDTRNKRKYFKSKKFPADNLELESIESD